MSRAEAERGATDSDTPGFTAAPRLRLLPLQPEPPDPRLVSWLADALGERLGSRASVAAAEDAPPSCWSPERSQLLSNSIVDTLIERYPSAQGEDVDEWILALTAADLTADGRRYVFGEAAMGGAWAVVSTARFGAIGTSVFRERVLKECLHELGHLAGLGHCPDSHCLMSASVAVDQVDAKRLQLCPRCRSLGGTNGT